MRTTIEIVLKECNATVVFYSCLVNGELKEIDKHMAKYLNMNFDMSADLTPEERKKIAEASIAEQLKNIPSTIGFEEAELHAKFLTKEIRTAEGETLSTPEAIASFVYDLSAADAEIYDKKVEEIAKGSKHSEESKKK